MRRAIGAIALALAACSSSNATPSNGASDGGSQAANDASNGAADAAAGDDGSSANACGAAPYVTLGITVTVATTSGPGAPIPGAKFTSTLCPGATATSDASGRIVGQVTKGASFYGRFVADNYASILTPEQAYASDDDAISIEMLPSLFTSIIKGYDATKGAIFIEAMPAASHDGGADPCDAVDGVSFAVEGHPELTPTYYSTDAIPQATTGTATTTSGRASFVGLDPGDPVTMTATKPGCAVTFVHGADTGRAPHEAGYVTLIASYVGDASDAGP